MSKSELESEIAMKLTDPTALATMLKNLASYLEG